MHVEQEDDRDGLGDLLVIARSMTGAVAAMAEPPQMEEPTPMSVAMVPESMRSAL